MQTINTHSYNSNKESNHKRHKPFLKGLPLISYFSGLRKNDKAICKEVSLLQSKNEPTKAYLYYPSGKEPSDLPGIFLPHGMNVMGIDDPRMVNLAKNLALSGYAVITPLIPEVTSLLINEQVTLKIMHLFNDFFEKKDYHEEDRLSFFSVSFSGSMGMIAFSQDKIRDKIRSAMVIGSCSHFVDTYLYANENFNIDNYAGLILFYNYLHFLDKKLHSEISKAIYEYAVDNALHRNGEDSLGALEHSKLRPASADFLHRIFQDNSFRSEVVYAIKDNLPNNLTRSLSPYYHLGGLRAPLSLLHGSTDPVISPDESKKIHTSLKNRNHPSHLVISDLITHGDQVPLHSQIRGIPGVTKSFGFYFSHI